ncbi:angiotensin-converting enzyme-like [Mytilus trossulus]|uniref:angiotensin-converting enzyme-like n=1 Tax=Mytilus trossulus TaxID=6551 RepID=UPI0030062C0F
MKLVVCLLWSVTLVSSLNRGLIIQAEAKLDGLRNALRELEYEFQRDETLVQRWFSSIDEEMRRLNNEYANAEWDFETNMTNETETKHVQMSIKASRSMKEIAFKARKLQKLHYLRKDTRRRLRLMAQFSDPTDKNVLEQLEKTRSALENIYAAGTLQKDGKVYNMEPELTKLMQEERNPDVLNWAWKGWRNETGKQMKSLYAEMVKLLNLGAVENEFSDYGDAWRKSQFDDTPELLQMCESLWKEVLPLYKKLHAFVRMRLKDYYTKHYPNYKFPTDGTIPAHLLGNMWAQEWQGVYEIVKPFPDVSETDVTKEMAKQNYDVHKLFTMAEEFYMSLGLDPMTKTFWQKSVLVRPENKKIQCHASATDFFTDESDEQYDDFRIKMCTVVDSTYFETIHHEMGHIQYFMEYRNQPVVFRDGANQAFHEAIGDTISLSVNTNKHLKAVGLIPEEHTNNLEEEKKRDLNMLMKQALFKIAFLPYGYLIDLWRFQVFDGTIPENNYNKEWWKLRLEYQGVSSPVIRTSEDFDPGAKFHIPSNSPYICYFVSFIVQFQFYESLCKASGHTGPLHTCDYYRSRGAGDKLRSFLQLGHSQPWREAMKVLTGSTDIKADAITEYFRPLTEWLDKELQEKGQTVGWEGAKINFE